MSGIAGFVEFETPSVELRRIERMTATLARRGPDGMRLWTGGSAALGHALLATTPEALADRQPWTHPESGCVVVADARLDNRPQLVRDLGLGAEPCDAIGDGALLHAAWQRWGEDCADRLRGDFAFAIWDARRRRLFCARDPMGVRPFYYFEAGRRFVFGSSAAAVLAHGAVPAALDDGRIADALFRETEGVDTTSTFYVSIRRLPPAHTLSVGDGSSRASAYWHPLMRKPAGLPRGENEWIDAQRASLERAVRLRLRSSQRVGSMLSGGLDSSSVVATASAASGTVPLATFSIVDSATPDCAETAAIRAVVDAVRCDAHLLDVEGDATGPRELRAWLDAIEEPFDGTMTLAAAVYAAAARSGVRGVMDGVPADNFFTTSGFDRMLLAAGEPLAAWRARRDYLRTFDSVSRPGLRAASVAIAPFLPRFLKQARRDRLEASAYARLLERSGIAPAFAHATRLRERYRRYRHDIQASCRWSPDGSAQSSLAAAYVTAGIERYGRVAAHFGVEPRPPFADRELIEFQAWMPCTLRLRDGVPKWVLRRAMDGLLPPEVAWRAGKEHLGARLSAAFYGRSPGLARRAAESPELRTWLRSDRVAELERGALGGGTGVALSLQPALLVATWLAERRGRADTSAAETSLAAPCPA